jgi:hypothetical protein
MAFMNFGFTLALDTEFTLGEKTTRWHCCFMAGTKRSNQKTLRGLKPFGGIT